MFSFAPEDIKAYADQFVQFCGDNEWIGAKSLLLVTPGEGLDRHAAELGEQIGFDPQTLKYVLLLFATYPLSLIFASLPSTPLKHLYSMVVGVWMLQFIYYSQWIHSVITIVTTYLMVLALPNRIMPYTVFTFVMAYMCASHIYRMYVDYMGWSLDFTGPQMVLTIKLSSFAFNVFDGRNWDKMSAPTGDKRKDRINESRRKYALRFVPSPLAYLGHMYCFTSILAGPAFEYSEYIGAINGDNFKRPDGSRGPTPPNFLAAMRRLFVGVVCLVLYIVGTPRYPLTGITSAEVVSKPVVAHVVWVWLALFFVRMRYYFAWSVADGGAILAGFGFEGYDSATGEPKGWDGVSNMDIYAFETSGNVAVNARAWNKRTQGWLERYVYNRTGNSLTATYFMSAFWHGFYPGYYLFFLSLPMATEAGRQARRKIRPYFLQADGETPGPYKGLYDVVTVFFVSLLVNYMVIPFQLLSWEQARAAWGSFYYAGHVGTALVYLACLTVIKTKRGSGKSSGGSKDKDNNSKATNGSSSVANGTNGSSKKVQ